MEPQPAPKPRMKPMASSTRAFFSLVAVALILGYLGRPPAQQLATGQPGQFVSGEGAGDESLQVADVTAAESGTTGDTSGTGATGSGTGATSGKKSAGKTAAAAGLACAPGRNGGKTDIGVSGTRIKLATTAALDGPAASLLRYSPTGMKAVIDKVNAAGGVCGRKLTLQVVNDSFNAALGHQFLGNWLDPKEDIFAFPVVPSAEGLSSAIQSGDIDKAGMPVVGTDGMRIEQYDAKGKAKWVWPVAAATVSTMRIIAKYAYEVEGARNFAVIWDGKYKFGVEGRDAFRAQVESLGGRMQADFKLDPDQAGYNSEVAEFNRQGQCGNGACDAVVMLLLPDTAKKWLGQQPVMGRVYSAGAQTLFTEKFGEDCVNAIKEQCGGFAVWTGYNPPIDRYATLPGVATYVSDLKRIDPGMDVRNQFLQGAYFGMNLFVDALKKVGPNLTRAELRKAVDSMDYKTDLASDLSWRPGQHNANVRARSFSVVVSGGAFTDWRDEGAGWRLDPAFGG